MSEQINESLDMLVTPQQILENSFTDGQARIPATQFRKHFWSTFGRRLMIFLIDDIPSKLLSVEVEPVESWISKREDLFLCFYDSYKDCLSKPFAVFRNSLNLYSSLYDNMILEEVSVRR